MDQESFLRTFNIFNAILREQVLENIVREPHDYSLMFQVVIAFQEPAAIPADEACVLCKSESEIVRTCFIHFQHTYQDNWTMHHVSLKGVLKYIEVLGV